MNQFTKSGEEMPPELQCYRADQKFKYELPVCPLGYTPEQISWSDGFIDGYWKAVEFHNIKDLEQQIIYLRKRHQDEWVSHQDTLKKLAEAEKKIVELKKRAQMNIHNSAFIGINNQLSEAMEVIRKIARYNGVTNMGQVYARDFLKKHEVKDGQRN
jgi:hypothetical protein